MLQEQPCGDTGGCRLRREWKHRQSLPRPSCAWQASGGSVREAWRKIGEYGLD